MQEMREGSLEEGMATHSSILARKIPWIEEPDRAAESDTTEVTEHTHTKKVKHWPCAVVLALELHES